MGRRTTVPRLRRRRWLPCVRTRPDPSGRPAGAPDSSTVFNVAYSFSLRRGEMWPTTSSGLVLSCQTGPGRSFVRPARTGRFCVVVARAGTTMGLSDEHRSRSTFTRMSKTGPQPSRQHPRQRTAQLPEHPTLPHGIDGAALARPPRERPPSHTSKCRCGPVDGPLLSTRPMGWPVRTGSPSETPTPSAHMCP